jgi:hypothetical protein
LAQPNFQYEKRQKELAKKKKQEEKRLRKLNEGNVPPAANQDQSLASENPEQSPDEGATA